MEQGDKPMICNCGHVMGHMEEQQKSITDINVRVKVLRHKHPEKRTILKCPECENIVVWLNITL